jgi:hypothetical protein
MVIYCVKLAAPTGVVVATDAFIGARGLVDQLDTVVRLLDAAGILLPRATPWTSPPRTRLENRDRPACRRLPSGGGWGGGVGYYGAGVAEGRLDGCGEVRC